MPIDFRNPLNGQGTLLTRLRSMLGGGASQAKSATETPDAGPAAQPDRVSLSDNAQRLVEAMHGNPVATAHDAGRIAEIRQAIESGTFSIDSSRIADKVRLHYTGR